MKLIKREMFCEDAIILSLINFVKNVGLFFFFFTELSFDFLDGIFEYD